MKKCNLLRTPCGAGSLYAAQVRLCWFSIRPGRLARLHRLALPKSALSFVHWITDSPM